MVLWFTGAVALLSGSKRDDLEFEDMVVMSFPLFPARFFLWGSVLPYPSILPIDAWWRFSGPCFTELATLLSIISFHFLIFCNFAFLIILDPLIEGFSPYSLLLYSCISRLEVSGFFLKCEVQYFCALMWSFTIYCLLWLLSFHASSSFWSHGLKFSFSCMGGVGKCFLSHSAILLLKS